MNEFWARTLRRSGEIFESVAYSPAMPSARTWLYLAIGTLMVLSLMMVASASMPFAMQKNLHELKYFWSQLGYMMIAIAAGVLVYQFPIKFWYSHKLIWPVFALMLLLLFATLFTDKINGARRWLNVFGFSFQPAELVKMFMVIIVSEYAYRRSGYIRTSLNKAVSLAIFYVPIIVLLLLQPDFGSTAVLAGTLAAMFVVVGVPILQFLGLGAFLAVAGLAMIFTSDYRSQRFTSFINPLDDPLGEDYQLLRSLVAFARGDMTGVGYGNSVQKLDHLPEAHTDFLLAITGEELGFLGVLLVIVLEFIIVFAIMRISYRTLVLNQLKLSYTSFGFGILIFGHLLINAGMNLGLLPTKGLTMPFFSYGGSSMLFSVIMIAIILKIDRVSPYIDKAGKNNNY